MCINFPPEIFPLTIRPAVNQQTRPRLGLRRQCGAVRALSPAIITLEAESAVPCNLPPLERGRPSRSASPDRLSPYCPPHRLERHCLSNQLQLQYFELDKIFLPVYGAFMSKIIQRKVARVVEGVDEQFRHRFGGLENHTGTTPSGCEIPLHLLYTFDTTDPAFPLQIPGIRYLPLYYSFPYNAGACGYQVKSETEIEVLYMETKTVERDFPYENYPAAFPERPVRLLPISYEQHKTLVFYLEADAPALSDDDRRLILEEFKYPFTQLGGIHRMWQGIPDAACPNPSCHNHRFSCFMEVFAVIWNQPHKGVFLWETPPVKKYRWEKDAGDDFCDTQVIFQICPKCFAIHACNRCT